MAESRTAACLYFGASAIDPMADFLSNVTHKLKPARAVVSAGVIALTAMPLLGAESAR
jgi:hypothetical protein